MESRIPYKIGNISKAKFEQIPPTISQKYPNSNIILFTFAELDQVREWSEQFTEKYPIVGKLLKPDETATVYTDDEADVDEKEIEAENKAIASGGTGARPSS